MLALDGVETAGSSSRKHGREAGAAKRLHQLLGVAPDLRVESACARRRTRRPRSSRAARSAASRRSRRRGSPARCARPATISDVPGRNMRPSTMRTCGRSARPRRRRRESRRWPGLPVSRLGRLISTTVSFDTSLRPSAPVAISGWVSTIAADGAVDAALHLGLRAAADHDHVVRLSRSRPASPSGPRPASAPSRTRTPPAPCRRPSAPW